MRQNQKTHPGPSGSIPRIIEIDPWLAPFTEDIRLRQQRYLDIRQKLLGENGSLADFANGHHYFGFHKTDDGWVYREWAPAADALFLFGDFNGWNRSSHPLTRLDNGCWEIRLKSTDSLTHQSLIKVHVQSRGTGRDRIPLYIHKVRQDPQTHDFAGQIWCPDQPFAWTDQAFHVQQDITPFIYEVHVGMAQQREGIGTYLEFEQNILPRIKSLGYNTIQIMAVMEHPYYASFGYHVSNYFAASSWFGSPDDLKSLINKAHELGITVLMDIVQSHAVKNLAEGINEFDGTDYQFFHTGSRGNHQAWDSKVFDYGKAEVIHFLLSSIKYWLEAFHFDGFRFDGVTSMLYLDHGLGTAFDRYDKYFSLNTDVDAVTYLQLANELIREIRPDAITVAEDMSGMPGMCLPIEDGGIGFDFRLAMGVPDFWIKMLEQKDDDWPMESLYHELSTARHLEKRIAYVESHDQALVGDKTLIFRMADQEMYWHMNKGSENLVIERAIALHKMIRLATCSLGADGYLTFMGNEFGHPEWIDFPREGNNWSFKHCQRLWSLAEDPNLHYGNLGRFDQAMVSLLQDRNLMGGPLRKLWVDQNQKIIAYRKQDHVFLFNFHPTESYSAFELPIHDDGIFQVILDTDDTKFGGQDRIDRNCRYETHELASRPGDRGIVLYVPSRTAMVLGKTSD